MTELEYEEFVEQTILEYAEDNIKIGEWKKDEALESSPKEFLQILPQGISTEGHFFFSIFLPNNNLVGSIWLGILPGNAKTGWIYQLSILKEHRRKGYARNTLEMISEFGKKLGLEKIGLHTFGHNQIAQDCYLSSNFNKKRVIMERIL